MISFKSFITETFLISEATASELYDKFYTNIPQPQFQKLYRADPFSSEDKFGPYSRWVLNIYRKLLPVQQNRFVKEDLPKLQNTLKLFNKVKPQIDKKDINIFKSLPELDQYLDDKGFSIDEPITGGEKEREIKKGIKKVYEDSDWLIVVPKTFEASCYYGSGTKWCTAGKSGEQYFDDYTEDGNLYIIISKNRKDNKGRAIKYQFHFESEQFVDIMDKVIEEDISNWIKQNLNINIFNFFDKKYKIFKDVKRILRIQPKLKTKISLNLEGQDLHSLNGSPKNIQGSFNCSVNRLVSLEGGPQTVGKNYICFDNSLKTLEGSPKTINGNFDASENSLTSLVGSPLQVNGDFDVSENELTSLAGSPQHVKGDFDISYNKISNLDGGPRSVGKFYRIYQSPVKSLTGLPQKLHTLVCQRCQITTLDGCPENIQHIVCIDIKTLRNLSGSPKILNGTFRCKYTSITSLKGSPEIIKGNFNCSENKLKSLDGIPKKVGGNFICQNNPVKFTEKQIRTLCEVKGKVQT